MPKQDEGTKKSRALPYSLEAYFTFQSNDTQAIELTIYNSGETGAAFQLYDLLVPDLKPKKYAVKSNSTLVEDGIYYNS